MLSRNSDLSLVPIEVSNERTCGSRWVKQNCVAFSPSVQKLLRVLPLNVVPVTNVYTQVQEMHLNVRRHLIDVVLTLPGPPPVWLSSYEASLLRAAIVLPNGPANLVRLVSVAVAKRWTLLVNRPQNVLLSLITPCLIRLSVRTLPAFLQTRATCMLCINRLRFYLWTQLRLLKTRRLRIAALKFRLARNVPVIGASNVIRLLVCPCAAGLLSNPVALSRTVIHAENV